MLGVRRRQKLCLHQIIDFAKESVRASNECLPFSPSPYTREKELKEKMKDVKKKRRELKKKIVSWHN